MTDPVTFRDLEIGDAGWLIERHAVLYARDEGFDASFEALVADILATYIRTRDPACERAFIAVADNRLIGSVFCVRSGEPGVAKLRLFLIEPEWRGRGLGRRLLDACLGFAREAGYSRLRLWTHESHRAACALYARSGFRLTDSRTVRSFGQDLVEQTWEIDLSALAIAGVNG
jgi:GNAT superfamily N-acetyltransferase